MAYLSRNDMEALGARAFANYKRLPCLQGEYLQRVEPEIPARDLLGLNVDHSFTKCPNCGEEVAFPPISFRLAR